jgi:hypothetical protein
MVETAERGAAKARTQEIALFDGRAVAHPATTFVDEGRRSYETARAHTADSSAEKRCDGATSRWNEPCAQTGRRLAAPYRFTFTTPTVKLLRLDWYRKNKRYDSTMVLALRFNQPVRAADVVSHTTLRFEPHPFDAPALSSAALARLRTNDPQAIPRFEAKVAAATSAASAAGSPNFSAATSWDTDRFKPSPDLVVLEVTDPTPPDS